MTATNLASVNRRMAIAASIVAAFALATNARADDPIKEIPETYRGTWVLRLYSDDAGKIYRTGDNLPICEITAKEIKFTKKVTYSDEKLTVKSVAKKEAPGKTNYSVTFENGKVWVFDLNGFSLTAIMYDATGEKLTETYRIVMKKR